MVVQDSAGKLLSFNSSSSFPNNPCPTSQEAWPALVETIQTFNLLLSCKKCSSTLWWISNMPWINRLKTFLCQEAITWVISKLLYNNNLTKMATWTLCKVKINTRVVNSQSSTSLATKLKTLQSCTTTSRGDTQIRTIELFLRLLSTPWGSTCTGQTKWEHQAKS